MSYDNKFKVTMKTIGYATKSKDSQLEPFNFERRELRSNDVAIEILYSGICHSDLHQARNDWGFSEYPMVPGHEIIGKVIEVGNQVVNHKIGDTVAVGVMVDSCLQCDQCRKDEEHLCRETFTQTYNSPDRIDKSMTYGGYSKHIVTREKFVLKVPNSLDISKAAPILCAGITTYSPLKDHNVGTGSRVGVMGLGGLGHMAVKLANAMGANVTALTTSNNKVQMGLNIGANKVIVADDKNSMKEASNTLDLIINTVPVKHDITKYIPLLDIKGEMVIVGQFGSLENFTTMPMVFGNNKLSLSVIGGLKMTQELLYFCAEHDIHPECEIIKMNQINDAFERLSSGNVSGRLVIDMASLTFD